MRRFALTLVASLVLPSCKGAQNADWAPQPESPPSSAAQEPTATALPEAEPDPWAQLLSSRVLAQSGLGVGGRLEPFEIVNTESSETYCQICRFGEQPKLMAVGTLDDPDFHEDLMDLDAITKKYEGAFATFAVITELRDGRGVTPPNPASLQERARALKAKLRIDIPVVVPAPDEGKPHPVWDEYYNITRSRTVMFANGENEILYSAIGPEDFSKLNEAILKLLPG